MTRVRLASWGVSALLLGALALPGCGGGRDENAVSFGSFGPGSDTEGDSGQGPGVTDTADDTDSAGSDATPSSTGGDSAAETASASETDGTATADPESDTEAETDSASSESDTAQDTDDGTESVGDESTGGAPLTDDPFDPAACEGTPLSAAGADALLGGLPRSVLATSVIQVRSRTCPGGACGAWSANEDWLIHYLTWSGGVKTRWKDLLAQMELVLFDDNGITRISMQHETFGAGGYPDEDGVVYDLPPVAQNYPHLRAFNEFPDNQYDYIDLDYQVSDGTLVLGEDCAVWTANPFGMGTPHLQQFGVLFRW